jgi:geranylgeranyl diphosphate synthase type I
MVVHALKRLEGEDKNRFLSVLGNQSASQDDVTGAIELLDRIGSIGYARQMALDYAKTSKELLGCLPESEHKDILIKITDYMVQRKK